MAKVFVKMGEGLESNCNLSGNPVAAGKVAEVSGSDALYVIGAYLGRKATADEIAEFLKAEGRESEIKKPEPKAKKGKTKTEEKAKVEKPAPEKKVEKPAKKDGPKKLEEMGFGELKKEAEHLKVKVTKAKGRITKADFIEAIKAKKIKD